MTSLDDLLAAVAENTLDPLPRLILGDWLEERGDARADRVREISAGREWPAFQFPVECAAWKAARYLHKLRRGVYPSVWHGKIWESLVHAISFPRRGQMTFADPDAVQAWDWAVKDVMGTLFPESPMALWQHPEPKTDPPWFREVTRWRMSINGVEIGKVRTRWSLSLQDLSVSET